MSDLYIEIDRLCVSHRSLYIRSFDIQFLLVLNALVARCHLDERRRFGTIGAERKGIYPWDLDNWDLKLSITSYQCNLFLVHTSAHRIGFASPCLQNAHPWSILQSAKLHSYLVLTERMSIHAIHGPGLFLLLVVVIVQDCQLSKARSPFLDRVDTFHLDWS